MNFNIFKQKKIYIPTIILLILWALWFLTHFLINFELNGSETTIINCGEEYIEKGAKASFLGKELDVKIQDNINTSKLGDYVVYYKTRNTFGIMKSLKREVKVKDKTAPKISLKGENPKILNLNEKYIEEGASAKDNLDGDLTSKMKITGNVNTTKYGEYQIMYEVSDNSGNSNSKIRKIIVKDVELPILELKGKTTVDILVGNKYEEEGYKATDNLDGDITSNVEITDKVNYNKVGNYEITYKIKDSSNNIVTKKRIINVVKKLLTYKDKYDKIDNTKNYWWSGNKFDHKRPEGGADLEELKKYNAYFLGPNKKVIYLTYDEGSNDTYLPEILEVLNKNDVKATFFLCRNYMLMNKDLIKKMEKTGHSVGNHTYHHYVMPSLATKENFDKYVYEIRATEEAYKEITGKNMDKVYREPKGEWSYRSLQIVKDLGYKTFFYSADYLDYGKNVTKEYALNKMMNRYHHGAIYLFHPKNKGNLEALDEFIKNMKKLGYTFDLVKNIDY